MLAVDLLNPSVEQEKRSHKLKRLVQSPNSYFMDVKCPGMFQRQAASTLPLSSAMLRLSFSALPAPPSCANPLVVVPVSLRAAPSAESSTKIKMLVTSWR
ncbi:hypothetical protein INT44_007647 [Umbelopsis vinacea]|uniref:Uncharacterized protein n=1 Tax=Umbelopsis vinacea TaxID=44442 RepID=A0A8H7PKI7_9FUNG|nr:hypothetical protein INT44_007647 [Umbelopsis vinacea]